MTTVTAVSSGLAQIGSTMRGASIRAMLEAWANLDLYTPLPRVADEARRIEALGFDVLCVPDLVHDGIAAAALAVQATDRIHVTTTALIAFPRSPMVVAVAAWDLMQSSGGRFSLGLGPQVRGNIVSRFSTPWTPPAPRMRDYIGALRAIFACWQHGEPLDFESEHYRFDRMQPYTSPRPLDHVAGGDHPIRIRLAAIGPNMVAVAGEVADGLHTHPTNACPRVLRERVQPDLERGAARVGRDTDDVFVVANPLCATGTDDESIGRQREEQRQLLATLLSTPSYWRALELYGWRERGERLHGLVRENSWDALAEVVDDEMLDAFLPTAPWPELGALLRERYAGLAHAITVPLPADPVHDPLVRETLEDLRRPS